MHYTTYIPTLPVCEFVERFWACSDTPLHSRERILPSGTIEVVINLSEDELRIYDPAQLDCYKTFRGAIVSGTYATPFAIDPSQHASIMGVHFRPGGAFPFLGAAVGELSGTHVSLDQLWGPSAVELRERLCAASSAKDRFRLMEEFLRSRLRSAWHPHEAVSIGLDIFGPSGTGGAVYEVAQRVGLSERRFIQVFSSQVGLTPKLFCRVLRFQRAQDLVGTFAKPDWARIAATCGYYDQSHLIRDFRQFSGISPTDYIRFRSERVMRHHLPVVE